MKYKEYKALDLPKVADEVLAYWKNEDVFEKSIASRDENKPFVFFEGPPSANGLPVFIMLFPERLKIYSTDIRPLRDTV